MINKLDVSWVVGMKNRTKEEEWNVRVYKIYCRYYQLKNT